MTCWKVFVNGLFWISVLTIHTHTEFVRGSLTDRPESVVQVRGGRAVFRCSTNNTAPIVWHQKSLVTGLDEDIFYGGNLLDRLLTKYSVDTSSEGHYDLVIPHVTITDAGTFSCIDDSGEQADAELTVLASEPVCTTNAAPECIVGANSCDMEPTEVHFACSLSFRGSKRPDMRWKDSQGKAVTQGINLDTDSRTDADSTATIILRVMSDQIKNGSSYTFTIAEYTWTSPQICIFDLLRKTPKRNTCGEKTVQCNMTDTSLSKYRWVSGEENQTIALGSELHLWNLTLDKYTFRCIGELSVLGHQCQVTTDIIECSVHAQTDIHDDNRPSRGAVIFGGAFGVAFILLLALLICIIIYKRTRIETKFRDIIRRRRHGPSSGTLEANRVGLRELTQLNGDAPSPEEAQRYEDLQEHSETTGLRQVHLGEIQSAGLRRRTGITQKSGMNKINGAHSNTSNQLYRIPQDSEEELDTLEQKSRDELIALVKKLQKLLKEGMMERDLALATTEKLQSKLQRNEDELKKIQQNQSDTVVTLEVLRSRLTSSETQIKELEAEALSTQRTNDELVAELIKGLSLLHQTVQSVENPVDDETSEVNEEQALTDSQKEEKLAATVTQIKRNDDEEEERAIEPRAGINQLKKIIQKLYEQSDSQKQLNRGQKEKLDQAKDDIEGQKQRADTAEEASNKLQKENEMLNERFEKLQKRLLASLETTKVESHLTAEAQTTIDQLTLERQASCNEVETWKKASEEAQTKVKMLEEELASRRVAETTDDQRDQLLGDLRETMVQRDEALRELQEATAQLEVFKRFLNAAIQKLYADNSYHFDLQRFPNPGPWQFYQQTHHCPPPITVTDSFCETSDSQQRQSSRSPEDERDNLLTAIYAANSVDVPDETRTEPVENVSAVGEETSDFQSFPSSSVADVGWNCPRCHRKFETFDDLANHMDSC